MVDVGEASGEKVEDVLEDKLPDSLLVRESEVQPEGLGESAEEAEPEGLVLERSLMLWAGEPEGEPLGCREGVPPPEEGEGDAEGQAVEVGEREADRLALEHREEVVEALASGEVVEEVEGLNDVEELGEGNGERELLGLEEGVALSKALRVEVGEGVVSKDALGEGEAWREAVLPGKSETVGAAAVPDTLRDGVRLGEEEEEGGRVTELLWEAQEEALGEREKSGVGVL